MFINENNFKKIKKKLSTVVAHNLQYQKNTTIEFNLLFCTYFQFVNLNDFELF